MHWPSCTHACLVRFKTFWIVMQGLRFWIEIPEQQMHGQPRFLQDIGGAVQVNAYWLLEHLACMMQKTIPCGLF